MDILSSALLSGQNLAIELVVAGVIFYGVEKLSPAEKDVPFFKDDFRQELGIAAFNRIITLPLAGLLAGLGFIKTLSGWMPYQIFNDYILLLPFALQVLCALFVMDFSTYWRHRLMHRFLWRVHSIHHSALHLTWLTALRLHPFEILVSMVFDATLLHLFGFEGNAITAALVITVFYNYYLHSNINISYPKPLRWILASPHFHRWHHATDKAAYDKNFCSFFSLLDLMFGTYYHPEKRLPEKYGLSDREQKKYPAPLLGQLMYPLRKKK